MRVGKRERPLCETSWLFEMVMCSWAVTLDGKQLNSLQSQLIERRRHFEEVKKVSPTVRLL